MTAITKKLLRDTIDFYNLLPKEERPKKIAFLNKQLQQHKNGVENIGLGYAEHFVQGTEIFLRIYKNK